MNTPLFTIILPVRNGGAHLKECVNSILGQTRDDFELAVLENCSDDGSAQWLASLNDPRIRRYPASQPLSMMENWARAVEVPKREFITFTGHDDRFDPDYLETLGALIAAHPEAALYHAHFRFIDENGRVTGPCRPMPTQETAAQFCQASFQFERDANGTGYVMRGADFERVGGFPHFHKMLYADHALWMNLVRGSTIVTSPHECFSYRIHARSTSASAQWRDHFAAIQGFITFMTEFEPQDEGTARAIRSLAPGYFFTLCKNWYSAAVVQATKENRKVEPGILEEFTAALQKIAPDEVERFKSLRSFQLRHGLNASWATRQAYNLYIRLRYGKGDLPASH